MIVKLISGIDKQLARPVARNTTNSNDSATDRATAWPHRGSII